MKTEIKIGRALSLCMSALLVTAMFFGLLIGTDAAKNQKNYDIAIAFDNSGSMYDNRAWCRAKYAMEIFASMLDYEYVERQ